MISNIQGIHKLLVDAGLKIHGINSDGIITWIDNPTEEELTLSEDIISNFVDSNPCSTWPLS